MLTVIWHYFICRSKTCIVLSKIRDVRLVEILYSNKYESNNFRVARDVRLVVILASSKDESINFCDVRVIRNVVIIYSNKDK